MDRVLKLLMPILVSPGTEVETLTDTAVNWSRIKKRDGGDWMGSFGLEGDFSYLSRWFYEYLGYHFEERVGGAVTWEGMIYEMDLTHGGVTRRITLDLLSNYVTTSYIDTAGETQTSSAVQNAVSVARYGRKEELLTLDGVPQAAAETRRSSFLKENEWPWPRVVNTNDPGITKLEVSVCGYVFTANWRFESAGGGSTDDVSAWVEDIVDTDCEFLKVGSIDANTLQIKKETPTPQRAFDTIMEVVSLGGADYMPWRFWVGKGRRAYYQKLDVTPRYFIRNGDVFDTAGSRKSTSNPWLVEPATFRDLSYSVGKKHYNGIFDDIRDFFVDEVEVSDEDGLKLKTEYFSDGDILQAQLDYQRQGTESGDDVPERLNWKRKMKLEPGTPGWEEAVKLGKKAYTDKYGKPKKTG